ncbi:MAG TPA: TIGR03621 family F420-dependent LLM class oxidoreductase [Chloroflexia bacterium]
MYKKHRPFRFGVVVRDAASHQEWVDKARRAEDLGFATFLVPDHFGNQLSPAPALATVACATSTLRIGSHVYDNDFRHPALLAKEALTLDLISDGRFELGIGAGWMRPEYEQTGIPFDEPAVRVGRLEEAVQIIKSLFGEEPVTFSGKHYNINGLKGYPPPIQRPHPPLLIGGGGKRMLTLAGREANIVALAPKALPDGSLETKSLTASATARKVAWIRQSAGERLDDLEINTLLQAVQVTADREGATARFVADWGLTPEEVLGSPHLLIGDIEQITEDLQSRREQFGISYVVVFEANMQALAPIVARLAGK